jgi:hypothetical protein
MSLGVNMLSVPAHGMPVRGPHPRHPLSMEWYLLLSLARAVAHGPPRDRISGCGPNATLR